MSKFYGDYHIHTRYSDGRATVGEVLDYAAKIGLSEVGFCDHGFANAAGFSLTRKKLAAELKELDGLIPNYPNLKIYKGIEADIINYDGGVDFTADDAKLLDVVSLGFHRYIVDKPFFKTARYAFYNGFFSKLTGQSKRARERNTDAYIAALTQNPVDVLVHINHHTSVDYVRLATACAELGVFVEINAKHLDELEKMIDGLLTTPCTFIVSSDAHKLSDVGKFDEVERFIERHAIPDERIANLGKRPVFRSQKVQDGRKG